MYFIDDIIAGHANIYGRTAIESTVTKKWFYRLLDVKPSI